MDRRPVGRSIPLKTGWLRFSLFSLCLHLTAAWLFWQGSSYTYGAAGRDKSLEKAKSAFTVSILEGETARQQPTLQKPANTTIVPNYDAPTKHQARIDFSKTREPIDMQLDPNPIVEPGADQEYFPAGSLTRLPAPASEIDLAGTSITADIALTGEIELTVLIDAHGMVADVIAVTEADELRSFSERVAEIFKSTRFIPGEINGKAVKSLLRITVVSENFSASEH